MGQTLQEMCEMDFGVGTEKVAGEQNFNQVNDSEMDKLAMEIGLFGDSEVVDTVSSTEKVASAEDLTGMYEEMFPEDNEVFGSEKTAAEQNEEYLGSLTHDAFATRFDHRIEKIAMSVMSGDAKVTGATASISGGNPHGDSRAPQTQPQNFSGGGQAMDTTPQIQNIITPQTGSHVSGQESKGKDATEKTAALAFHKQLLLNQLSN